MDVCITEAQESEINEFSIYNFYRHMPELDPYAKAHILLAGCRVLGDLRAGCLPLQLELGRSMGLHAWWDYLGLSWVSCDT